MAARERSYLERHGSQWRVIVKVPEAARALLGRAHLKHGLGTNDLSKANLLKWPHVQQFQRQIAAALSGSAAPQSADSWEQEAKTLRHARRVQPPQHEVVNDPISGEQHLERVDSTADYIAERADQIEQAEGIDAALEFVAAAHGKAIRSQNTSTPSLPIPIPLMSPNPCSTFAARWPGLVLGSRQTRTRQPYRP